MKKLLISIIFVILFLLPQVSMGLPITLDLNSRSHGEIINGQFSGVTISGYTNDHRALNEVIIFDTRQTGTQDPDLEDQEGLANGDVWSGGNIKQERVGNVLILPERDRHLSSDGRFVLDPNDEGGRPAGYFLFEFDYPISSFGFDLIDMEGEEEFNDGYFAAFLDDEGNELSRWTFEALGLKDSSIEWGNNTANRIYGLDIDFLGIEPFNMVKIGMGGSGAITGINFTPAPVPEPTTIVLLGSGIIFIGLANLKRKRFK